MTGTELATCLRNGQAPIVVILNNRGYSTEREIMDGPFNDLHEWQYEKICEMIGGGVGHRVSTYGELVDALNSSITDTNHLHVLNVLLDPTDRSTAMVRLGRRLAKQVSLRKS